jgi:hypothetical protein
MSKNSGIIYDLGNNRYGLAIHSEQKPEFSNFKRVYLHVFTDSLCTKPELDPKNGKKYVTLKHISQIKAIGFSD